MVGRKNSGRKQTVTDAIGFDVDRVARKSAFFEQTIKNSLQRKKGKQRRTFRCVKGSHRRCDDQRRRWAHLALVFATAAGPVPAFGSAFQILEQSPAHLGKAFAGTASSTPDGSTVFFNSAAMTRLDGRVITGGINAILVQAEFNDTGSTTGGSPATTDDPGFVPNLYLVQPLSPDWSFGFGINAPFGLASSYDEDWTGRYLATDSELEIVNVNGTIAYQFNEALSVGAGLNYQEAQVVLESQVDSTFGLNPNPATDSSAAIRGDDSALAVDLSVHWLPADHTSVGASWRQGAEFSLTGEAVFDLNEQCRPEQGLPTGIPPAPTTGTICSQVLGALGGDVEADVEMPDTFTLSVSHRLTDAWELHGDVAWTGWSTIDTIEIINTDNSMTVDELELRYDDTMRYSLGVTYATNSPWTWRIGTALDEAPQTDPQYVTPRIPDQDRLWLSAGFNYRLSRLLTVDAGFAHLFVDDATINDVDPDTGHQVRGNFDSSVNIIGVQANWYW